MVLELVASRLIARHLGSSLYTWTAVIGVVLAGITIGNYMGGRIADKYQARKALAVLFGLSSAACVITVMMNNLVGEWVWLWQFSWPSRVFSHVTLVFLLPSILLGTISPVVAKMALERGLSTGRTIGDIYAWGAAGSIFGTFAAGFYLIAAMGTIAIIWTVAAVLLLMAILYMVRLWPLYIWAVVFVCALVMASAPLSWCQTAGAAFRLRQVPDSRTIYEDESQYCYITIKRISEEPDKRSFIQDKLTHSKIDMTDITALQYTYEQIYAAVTNRIAKDKKTISALVIGGGGYVYPRYLEKMWPGSRIDVVEIDPRVTEAAVKAFGLSPSSSINSFNMDARNYVDELVEKQAGGENSQKYDFIYEDAVTDYSVPYQLTTKEFNDKIASLLSGDGIYLIEMIDIYDSALFLGAFTNTLEQTFPYVYVITQADFPHAVRNTFVIVAAMHRLDLKNVESEYNRVKLNLWLLDNYNIDQIKEKAGHIVLTDDYAPVENLLAPIVRESSKDSMVSLANRHVQQAQEFQSQKKFDEAIAEYKRSLEINVTADAFFGIGSILAEQGNFELAIKYLQNVIQLDPSFVEGYVNLGLAYQAQGNSDEAIKQFSAAIKILPNFAEAHYNLADAYRVARKFNQAIEQYRIVMRLKPDWAYPISNLAWVMATHPEIQGRDVNEAVQLAYRACELTNFSDPLLMGTLAASYAAAGNFPKAIEIANAAAKLAEASNNAQLKNFIQYHLSFYVNSKPYIEALP